MAITSELANQLERSELGPLVELFIVQYAQQELYLTPVEGGFTFDGNTFEQFPIEIEGVEKSQVGASPRPVINIGNINSLFTDEFKENIIGSRVTRIITFEEYQNTNISLPTQTFIVDRIVSETFISIQLELASPFDLQSVILPRRRIVGGQCPWVYKGRQVGRNIIASTAVPRGGCTWRQDSVVVQDNGSNATVYMNARDEYIINSSIVSTATEFLNDGSITTIAENDYYYTESLQVEIDATGKKLTDNPSTFRRYWQAVKDQTETFPSIYKEPKTDSTFWREVKTYTKYDKNTIYKGYVNSEYNDYVVVHAVQSGEDFDSIDFVKEDPRCSVRAIFKDFTSSHIAYYFDISELFEYDASGNLLDPNPEATLEARIAANDFIVSVSHEPNTPATNLTQSNSENYSSFTPLTYVANAHPSTIAQGEFSIDFSFPVANTPFIIIGHNDVDTEAIYNTQGNRSVPHDLNLNFEQFQYPGSLAGKNAVLVHISSGVPYVGASLHRVKDRSIDPSLVPLSDHRPNLPVNPTVFTGSKYWIDGDQCSKTLTGCSKRFNAQVAQDYASVVESVPGISPFIYAQADNLWRYAYHYNYLGDTGQTDPGQNPGYYLVLPKTETASLDRSGICSVKFFFNGEYRLKYPHGAATVTDAQNLAESLGNGVPVYSMSSDGFGGVEKMFTRRGLSNNEAEIYPLFYYYLVDNNVTSEVNNIQTIANRTVIGNWEDTNDGDTPVEEFNYSFRGYNHNVGGAIGSVSGKDVLVLNPITESIDLLGEPALIGGVGNLNPSLSVDMEGAGFDPRYPVISSRNGPVGITRTSAGVYTQDANQTKDPLNNRFGVRFLPSSSNSIISANLVAGSLLPFGGFPGSRKFK